MNREKIYSRGEQIGPYTVERVLATGGMGIVYEAKPDPVLRGDLLSMGVSTVAVKAMRLNDAALSRHDRKQLVERMDREFQTLFDLTRLGHPNVVKVYDFGRDEGVPYYVMELVDGITLEEAMREQPRFGEMMHVFAKLCGAVTFLHEGGICHRDLKPSNVMIRRDGGDPVLIDFGICLPPGERTLTGAHDLLGTPQYLSPEYAAHWMNPAETRAYVPAPTDDVWALGVILYEMLTGGTPWRTPPERREALLKEIQTATPAHPTDVYPRAPRLLGDVALQLLEKEWRKRPVNAHAVLGLLGPAAEGSDVFGRIPERRPPPAPRQTTWDGTETRAATPGVRARRHTAAAPGRQSARFRTAELAAFATLVVLLLVGLLIHDRRMHARDEAMAAEASARQEKLASAASQCPDFREAEPGAGITPAGVYGADGAMKWGPIVVLAEWKVPKYPIEKQARAPCRPREIEINGGCWTAKWSLREGDECPEGYFRHGNECYAPVRDPKYPLPTRDPNKPSAEWWDERDAKTAR